MLRSTMFMKPLRTCRVCGLEAFIETDLSWFVRDKRYAYGYSNRCKRCHRERMKQRKQRTNEFIKIFRTRSPDEIIKCYFCNEKIMKLRGRDGESLSIHSLDENHENWNPTNKVPTHTACHTQYHMTGEKNPKWKGDEASNGSKRRRARSYPQKEASG